MKRKIAALKKVTNDKLHIDFINQQNYMASKQIYAGVGIPMIIVGALMAFLWAPTNAEFYETIEFVGGLIGILGIVFFFAGLFYAKEPIIS